MPVLARGSPLDLLITSGQRLFPVANKLYRHIHNAEMLDETGWLPHYSMPFKLIDECEGDADVLGETLSQYYSEMWPEVRHNIDRRLNQYNVNDEAKETFREALNAHESGLYRSVCALLIPGIERVSRIELHENRLDRIASQHELRELAKRLPISAVDPGGFFTYQLYKRLDKHMFEHIDEERDRQRLAHDPVPNRHAIVHGYVVYSTMQNSLNAIFMADFVLQLISVMKTRSSSDPTDPLSSYQ